MPGRAFFLGCRCVVVQAEKKTLGEYDGKQHCSIDVGKEVQPNVPPSDPISCFTSDDEEMLHAPTRKGKRPFEEVNLDSKAGKHGSPEDQKRRNSGPPQHQTWHTLHSVQGKRNEPFLMQLASELPSKLVLPTT